MSGSFVRFLWRWLPGLLMAIVSVSVHAQTVEYIHTDALGTPVAVTNSVGTVIERNDYEPYGKLLSGPITDGPGFTGHVQDAATGLTYMQQRYYDPGIGRFLSVDPVAANGGTGSNFNRYKYASNNPYKFTDPDGRSDLQYMHGAVSQDTDLMAATDGFNPNGWFSATGHGSGFGFRDDRSGVMPKASVPRQDPAAFMKDARAAGLKPGQPILLIGCGLGYDASEISIRNNSFSIATQDYVMIPSTAAKYGDKAYKAGDPITFTANKHEDGKGPGSTFSIFGPNGQSVMSNIQSITYDPGKGTLSFKSASASLGSRIPRTEVVKLKK